MCPAPPPAPALLRRAPPRLPPPRSRPRPAAGGLRARGPSPACSVCPRAHPPARACSACAASRSPRFGGRPRRRSARAWRAWLPRGLRSSPVPWASGRSGARCAPPRASLPPARPFARAACRGLIVGNSRAGLVLGYSEVGGGARARRPLGKFGASRQIRVNKFPALPPYLYPNQPRGMVPLVRFG